MSVDLKIALFGTTFMDIKGFSANTYDPKGRNVGTVRFVHGGVGRNIAENLGSLGMSVSLASTADVGAFGDEILARLEATGVDTRYVLRAAENGVGMFLAILDESGELAGSISKQPDLRFLEQLVDERGDELMRSVSHVAVEVDLTESLARKIVRLAKEHNKPIYGLPGNMEVVLRCPDVLRDMECFICNDVEACKLFGIAYDAARVVEDVQREMAAYLERSGIKILIVTLGEKGAAYFSREMERPAYCPVHPVRMVDSTGAGDAFFSGALTALTKGRSLGEAVCFASEVAAYTIRSEENTCRGFLEGREAQKK